MVVHLVDSVDVEPERVPDYLDALETLGIPVMTSAGASFVSCSRTLADLGEPARLDVVWAFEDFEQWNEIRKHLVLDPRWYEYGDRIALLRLSGTRRFYLPVSFGAPPV
jgi:hypothetical protein